MCRARVGQFAAVYLGGVTYANVDHETRCTLNSVGTTSIQWGSADAVLRTLSSVTDDCKCGRYYL